MNTQEKTFKVFVDNKLGLEDFDGVPRAYEKIATRDTYSVKLVCQNCSCENKVTRPRGYRVTQIYPETCCNCGLLIYKKGTSLFTSKVDGLCYDTDDKVALERELKFTGKPYGTNPWKFWEYMHFYG